MRLFPQNSQSSSGVSRRDFLGTCSLCCAGLAVGAPHRLPAWWTNSMATETSKTKVKLIFAYPDPKAPNWPNINYDFAGHIKQVQDNLAKQCPNVEFHTVSTMTGNAAEGKKLLAEGPEVDGQVFYLAGCLWGDLTETIGASGKPTIMVDHLFAGSGEFLTSYARSRREGHKVMAVSSSNFKDLVDAIKILECIHKLKESRALVVGNEPDPMIQQVYGTQMLKVEFAEINDGYNRASKKDVDACTDRWIKNAQKVIEPSREEIAKAAGMYLAMRTVMQNNQAQAITVNCLGGIYSGKMVTAYPCLGFMQLDNEGLVGACEADQRSTMTKLLMTYLAGRPGFISDPVIDTAKNQIIYAHCVAPTKMYGPDGPTNPYHIRDHSEDRKGACNRSLLPLGEMTTTLMFDHKKKQVILHQGKSVENVYDDKACRTKLAVEVKGDVYKLLNYWDEWGWHRVTFYGDLKRPVYNIAALLGFQVIEEA